MKAPELLCAASLALLLAGCGDGGDAPPTVAASESAQDGLRGDWIVTSTWGDPAPDDADIHLTIGDTIVMRSQCVESEWRYSVVGDEVRTRFLPRTTCLRTLTRDEKTVQDQITAGFTFARDETGVLRLETGVGPLTLAPAPERSVRDVAAEEIGERMPQPSEPWPESLQGDYRLAGIDGKPFDATYGVAIHIGQDRIEFENCQQIVWRYTYDPPAVRIERTPAITIDINPKPLPCAATLPPGKAEMVEAIDAAEQAERTPENGLRLSGKGRSVTLFSQ